MRTTAPASNGALASRRRYSNSRGLVKRWRMSSRRCAVLALEVPLDPTDASSPTTTLRGAQVEVVELDNPDYNPGVDIHIIGFTKAVGDIADSTVEVFSFFGLTVFLVWLLLDDLHLRAAQPGRRTRRIARVERDFERLEPEQRSAFVDVGRAHHGAGLERPAGLAQATRPARWCSPNCSSATRSAARSSTTSRRRTASRTSKIELTRDRSMPGVKNAACVSWRSVAMNAGS